MAKRQSAQVLKRRRLVRQLLVKCVPRGEVVRLLVEGVTDEDGNLGTFQVSESTARRDVEAVETEFRDLFTDADAADVEIGQAFEAYKEIARDARTGKRPNYHAAISALDRVVKIAASRSEAWAHLAGTKGRGGPVGELPPLTDEDQDELVARAREVSAMEDQELVDHHRALRSRVDALGLRVLEGDKSASGDG